MSRIIARIMLFSAVSLVAISPAQAHETAKGPNGGPVVEVAGHHVEFVQSPTEITLYLTGDANAPIASAGAKFKAIVQDSGKTSQLALGPVDPNKLVAKLPAPLGPGSKVVVTGTLADGHSVQARFVAP